MRSIPTSAAGRQSDASAGSTKRETASPKANRMEPLFCSRVWIRFPTAFPNASKKNNIKMYFYFCIFILIGN
jgi:hypothetical protein